jgi:hypothetical protein
MEIEKHKPVKGIYSAAYTLEEVTALISQEMDNLLEDELTAVRIALRRTLLKLREDLEPAEFAVMVSLTLKGANTIANLLRTRRAISGQAADGLTGAMAQILLELEIEQAWKI